MGYYIRSASSISPQNTFGKSSFLAEPVPHTGNCLTSMEPDYTKFIDPKSLRRMSRIIKMGVAAAMECLQKAGVQTPDAIVTGTAYGCLEDTEIFLTRMVENKEELLSPTAFIQSTHNTVGAQIALLLKCHQYNNTFVHRGFSFESALLDAMMLLEENKTHQVLVGGLDEITSTSYAILSRLGIYKQEPVSSLNMLKAKRKGTIAGEGTAFFLLANDPSGNDLARLDAMDTFYKPADDAETKKNISSFLVAQGVDINGVDLVITGRNGDERTDRVYNQSTPAIFGDRALIRYKQLCGEYPTSTAFALWLAAGILKNGFVPDWISEDQPLPVKTIKRILIYNHYQNIHHSLFLVSAC
jgi:3-oxoacyl-(acyl-carrier-protein) synthase